MWKRMLLLLALLGAGAWSIALITDARRAVSTAAADSPAPAVTTRRVWSPAHNEYPGSVPSLDGRYLPYVDYATGDLAVLEIETGAKRRLTGQPLARGTGELVGEFSVPSPDGDRIAYTWYTRDGGFELRVIGTTDSVPRTLLRATGASYLLPFDWSRDGAHIAVLAQGPGRITRLLIVSAADGSTRTLKSLGWRGGGRMTFSPDGQFLAYDVATADTASQRDIFILSTDASREVAAVQHSADDFLMGWSPDGTQLLFGSDRTGTPALYALPVADGRPSGEPQLVKDGLWRTAPMGFTRGGSLFYSVFAGVPELYVARLDPGSLELQDEPTRITGNLLLATNASPVWSPDGNSIAFKTAGRSSGGKSSLLIHDLRSGQQRELMPRLSGFHTPEWTHDGRALLFIGVDDQQRSGVYKIDGQTGELVLLFREDHIHGLQLSPDGTTLWYGSRAGRDRILARNLQSGRIDTVFASDSAIASYVQLLARSPSGDRLATTSQLKTQVLVLPSAGGTPREVYRVPDGGRHHREIAGIDWLSDSHLLLLIRSGSGVEPWRLPAEGGEPELLSLGRADLGYVRPHPDGQRIAFMAGLLRSEVWAMDGLPGSGHASIPALERGRP